MSDTRQETTIAEETAPGAGRAETTDPVDRPDHGEAFERAWSDPSNTRFELPPVDVNRVLAERYRTDEPLALTRDMLWDVEVRKAWRPDRYIPSAVREGSARTWGGRSTPEGNDTFLRASRQPRWLEPAEDGLVLERTRLDFRDLAATFVGAAELPGPEGGVLRADRGQPLFHVEHSVGGEPGRPLNRWRIVHLTEEPDPRLLERFERMAEDPWLPEFVEVYLRDDLGVGLECRDVG